MYDTVEKVFARPGAAGAGPECAAGDQDLPEAAGKWAWMCLPTCTPHPLCGQDDPRGQKRRRDAAREPSLPRADKQEGALTNAERYHHRPALPGTSLVHRFDPRMKLVRTIVLHRAAVCGIQPAGLTLSIRIPCADVQGGADPLQDDPQEPEAHSAHRGVHGGAQPVLCVGRGRPLVKLGFLTIYAEGVLRGAWRPCVSAALIAGTSLLTQHHQPHRADGCR